MYLYAPNDKNKVVAYCQRAIQGFKRLKYSTERVDDRIAYDWYEDKIDLMKKTLDWIIKKKIFS